MDSYFWSCSLLGPDCSLKRGLFLCVFPKIQFLYTLGMRNGAGRNVSTLLVIFQVDNISVQVPSKYISQRPLSECRPWLLICVDSPLC